MQEVIVIDEITPEVVNHLTAEEKQKWIDKLTSQEKEIFNSGTDRNHILYRAFKNRTDIFKDWASILEQLHYLGKFEKPIKEISSHIRWQIGKMDIEIEKKENIYAHLDRYLEPKYKHGKNENHQNGDKNTSDLVPETEFLRNGLSLAETFCRKLADNIATLNGHLESKEMHEDFLGTLEWKNIASFCYALEDIVDNQGILDQIDAELNIRESATFLQKAMILSMKITPSFRQMSYMFGISTRQGQRVRTRDEDWPLKEKLKVIQKCILSYQCQNCGHNPVTGRTHDDVKMLDEKTFLKIKLGDKKYPIPDKLKGRGLNPIDIARLIWEEKLKIPN